MRFYNVNIPVRYGLVAAVFLILSVNSAPRPLAAEGAAIEELVVYARKRGESLQEIPVAVSAFTEEEIDQVYGNDIGEFSKYTPNVVLVRQPYAGNALLGGMRGITFGDLEKSFDPAVGVVVDGVPLVTNTSALIDTFDLESLEILRGPQGTLFGRNTIAGVVNVRRSYPTKQTGVKAQFRYGSNNEQDYKIVANFGNNDNFGVKLGAFIDKRDLFTERADFDLATGEISGTGSSDTGEDTKNFIASILWETSDALSLQFTYTHTDDKSVLDPPTNMTVPNLDMATWDAITGQMFAAIDPADPSTIGPAVGGAVAATAIGGGNFCDYYGTTFAPLSQLSPQPLLRDIACASQGYLRGEENGYKYNWNATTFTNEIEQNAYTFELNWDVSDSMLLTSITNLTESEEILDEDNMATPIPIFNPVRPQDYEQWSTELRLTSNFEGPVNILAGLYYVENEYEITQTVWAFGARQTGGIPTVDGDAGQELSSVAIFGEVYWGINDKTTLTLGGRWTEEEKKFWVYQRISGDGVVLPPGGGTDDMPAWGCGNLTDQQQAAADQAAQDWISDPTASPIPPPVRAAALVCNHPDGIEKWDRFTPRVALDYRFTDDIMGYVSYAQGWRSGGWNGRVSTPSGLGPYEPEIVDSYEIGIRSDLADGTLRFNATAFFTDYKDKHQQRLEAFGFSTQTLTENASSAEIRGFEIESTWAPTEKFLARLALGHNDGEYKEFIGVSDISGEVEDIADERDFAFAPKWNANIGLDFFQPVAAGDMLIFRTNWSWADGTAGNFGRPDPTGLERNIFPDRHVWDFSVIWQHADWLTVTGFVKDAFHDDNYLATSVDAGVFWFGQLAPGRLWGLEIAGYWQ